MNFSELSDMFFSYTGASTSDVDDTDLAFWFNEAQLDLSFDLGPVSTITFENAVAGNPYDIPATALQILDCSCACIITCHLYFLLYNRPFISQPIAAHKGCQAGNGSFLAH